MRTPSVTDGGGLATTVSPDSVALVEAATELTQAHYDEIATDKRLMVLDPDWKRFHDLEAADALLTLIMRVDGEMVGYSVSILVPQHLHYRGLAYAHNDLIFVRKDMRGHGRGVRLIKATEYWTKEMGHRALLWHAKEGTPLDTLLRRMGYRVQDIMLLKEL